jgi:hypothetical protein
MSLFPERRDKAEAICVWRIPEEKDIYIVKFSNGEYDVYRFKEKTFTLINNKEDQYSDEDMDRIGWKIYIKDENISWLKEPFKKIKKEYKSISRWKNLGL